MIIYMVEAHIQNLNRKSKIFKNSIITLSVNNGPSIYKPHLSWRPLGRALRESGGPSWPCCSSCCAWTCGGEQGTRAQERAPPQGEWGRWWAQEQGW